MGSFKVDIGRDGAPFGKDDQAAAWLFRFLNCTNRVCSSAESFFNMKYLTILGGELTISASSISPFADAGKSEINCPQGTFGLTPEKKWKPWKYRDRLKVAVAVAKKKEQIVNSPLRRSTKRVNALISQKNSRQLLVPVVGKITDNPKQSHSTSKIMHGNNGIYLC